MVSTTPSLYSISDARRDHDKWFSDGAMRFFGTQLHNAYRTPSSIYVVTSEAPPHGDRTWGITRFSATECDRLGPGPDVGLGSHDRARALAKTLAIAERNGGLRVRENYRAHYLACDVCQQGWAQWQLADRDLDSLHLVEGVAR